MPAPKKNSNPKLLNAVSTTAEAPAAPQLPTSGYSKRANRGYNPKYEQDSYISLCGSKRKAPDATQKEQSAKNNSKKGLEEEKMSTRS